MTPDNSDKFTHRSPPRLHFPKLTKSAKPAAISTLTTLSFPKTYKCLEWTRTNPFSKTYKSWHCGEEQVGGGYSNATSHGQWPAPTILCAHWASVGQSGTKFYPLLSSWCSTIVTECLALSQHDVLACHNVSRLLLTSTSLYYISLSLGFGNMINIYIQISISERSSGWATN